METTKKIVRHIDRTGVIRAMSEAERFVRQRVGQEADLLSKLQDLKLILSEVDEALTKLVALLYEKADDGKFINLDLLTGKLLVSAPWGSKGWKKWGLRHWEGVVLGRVLQERAKYQEPRPLFFYRSDTTNWYADTGFYPSKKFAMEYLQRYPITVEEWRRFSTGYITQRKRSKRVKDKLKQGAGFVKPTV